MIEKIVSGGQTGVDRAALDAALDGGVPCGGWCPLGRRAEDGVIDGRYPLTETPTPDYPERTEWNVRDSDGTLILTHGQPDGGTKLTVEFANALSRPVIVIDLADRQDADVVLGRIWDWIDKNAIRVLNVAGPRGSKQPDIYEQAYRLVGQLLASWSQDA